MTFKIRKLLTISALLLCMVYPATANIPAGTNSLTCNATNLETNDTNADYESQWTPNVYTIILNDSANGGSGGDGTIKEVFGSGFTNSNDVTITSVTVPTKANASFLGYFNTQSGSTQYINSYGVIIAPNTRFSTNNTTIYAQFANCTCVKGDHVDTCSVTGVTSNKCQYSYTCENGYHIGTGTDTSGTFEGNIGVGSNTSPACNGNRITLAVGNHGHGTLPSVLPRYCIYGNNFTTPASMSETGYTFNGWVPSDGYLNPLVNTPLASSTSVTCNYANLGVYSGTTTLAGSWTPNTYTVTLNKNADNAVAGTASVTATYDSAMPTSGVTMPTRTGYTFAGYYDTDAATGGTQYYTANGASARTWNKASDTTLYARWSANTNTITLDARYGTGTIKKSDGTTATITQSAQTTTFTCTTAASMSLPTWSSTASTNDTTNLEKADYKFLGWSTSSTCTTSSCVTSPSSCPAANKTYYAVWQHKDNACTACAPLTGCTCNLSISGNNCTYTTGVSSSYPTWVLTSGAGTNAPTCTACSCTPGDNVSSCTATGNSNNKCSYDYTCDTGYHTSGSFTATSAGVASNSSPACSANTYNITYTGMAGATYGANHPTNATYDVAFTVNNPTKSGSTFAGWKITGMDSVTHYYGTSSDTSTSKSWTKETSFKNLTSVNGGTVTFEAQWCKNCNATSPCTCTMTKAEGTTCTYNTGVSDNCYYISKGANTPAPTCSIYTPKITASAGYGVGTLTTTASGWDGSGSADMTKPCNCGDKINLYDIVPNYKDGYTGRSYSLSGGGDLAASYTCGTTDGIITINATGISTPTATISGGTTKVYNYEATTLTAGNAGSYDSGITLNYEFGSSDTSDGTYTYGNAQTENTTSVAKDAYRGTKYYKVKVTATDGTLTSSTATSSSPTTMTLNNKTITFDPVCGTRSGTSPLYVSYNNASVYTGTTNTTSGTVPTASQDKATFTGWYTAASGGSKVYNASGSLQKNISGYTSNTTTPKWITTSDRTLYAQYTCADGYYKDNSGCCVANTCTVTFKTGNTSLGTENFTYGTSKALTSLSSLSNVPSALNSNGWSFAGWSTGADATTEYTDGESLDNICTTNGGSITLYGVWTRSIPFKYYSSASANTVTTNNRTQSYYNTSATAADVNSVSTYSLYNSTAGGGWEPLGWVNSSSVSGSTTATTTTTSVKPAYNAVAPTYYALYNRTPVISYNANGHSGSTSSSTCDVQKIAASGTASSSSCTLASNGFSISNGSFSKWAAGSNTGTQYSAGTSYTFPNTSWTGSDSYTMYAIATCNDGYHNSNGGACSANTYTVTFKSNNATSGTPSTTSVTCTYGENCPAFATQGTLSKTNNVFGGWNENANGTGTNYAAGANNVSNLTSTNGGNVDLYAKWTECSCTNCTNSVSSNTCGGTCSTGYQTSNSNTGTNASCSGTSCSCVAKTYTITYDLNDISGSANPAHGTTHPTTYKITDSAITLSNPSMTGYTFGGWDVTTAPAAWGTGSSSSGSTNFKIATGTYGDIAFKAKWTANTNTVTLNKNADNAVAGTASVTATYDSAMPTDNVTMPTRTGYTFAGYYDTDAATGGTQYYTANGASARTWNKTSDTTLYARWTANVYSVTLNKNTSSSDTTTVATIYEKYATGIYTDSGATTAVTTSSANVTKPTRDPANHTTYTFNGYWTERTGGTQMITAAGSLTSSFTNTYYTSDTTLYAQWKMTCDAGYMIAASALKCSTCTANYYCPGGTAYEYKTSRQGRNSCSSGTSSKYTKSAAGSSSVNDCYLTLTAGNEVTSAGNGATSCRAGGYCDSTANIYYGGTHSSTHLTYGGRTECAAGTYNAGTGSTSSSACVACATGSYSSGTGNTACTACAAGKTNTGTGNTSACTTNCPDYANKSSWLTTTWSNSPTANTVSNLCEGTYNTYTITLNDSTNGGSGGSGTIKEIYNTDWTNNSGTTISSVTVPTKANSVFTGYYNTSNGSTKYIDENGSITATNTTFTSNTTIYAKFAACTCTKPTGVATCTVNSVSGNKCVYDVTYNSGYFGAALQTNSTAGVAAYTATVNTCTNTAGASYTASDGNRDSINTCYIPNCSNVCSGNAAGNCPDSSTCTYDTSYTYTNGTQHYGGSCTSSGTCPVTSWSCLSGYYHTNSGCSLCSGVENTSSTQSGTDTTSTATCPNGSTKSGATSTSQTYTQTCAGYFTGGAGGTNDSSTCTGCSSWGNKSYETCIATSCINGAYLSSGSCYLCSSVENKTQTSSGSEPCDIANGAGSRTYTDTCNGYYTGGAGGTNDSSTCTGCSNWTRTTTNTCYVTSCDTGYHMNASSNATSCAADEYTVTLNKNANNAVAGTTSVTATYNSAMPTSGVTMPTRTGYTFAGYYDTDAATGGTQYYTANGASARTWNKTSDTTLYARWEDQTAPTITVVSGSTNILNKAVNVNAANGSTNGTLAPKITAEDSGSGIALLEYAITTSTTVPTSGFVDITSSNGTALSISKPLGYYYVHVRATDNAGNVATAVTKYMAVRYRIYYYDLATDSSYVNVYWYSDSTSFTTRTPAAKTGYTVKGWYSASSGGTKIADVNVSYTPTKSIKLYAQWQPNTYTISYTLNNGTAGTNAPTSGSYDSVVTIDNPTRAGYTFTGWNISGMDDVVTHYYGSDNPPTNTTTDTTLSTDVIYYKNLRSTSGTVTFTAGWAANTNTAYKVYHYTKNLGATTYTQSGDVDNLTGTSDASLTLANLKRTITGFTYSEGFAGTSATGANKPASTGAVTSTTILADGTRVISLYYTRDTHTVTLTKGTGIATVTGAGTYEYGKSVTLGATMNTGYDWSKWTETSGGTQVSTTKAYSFTMGTSDIAYTANAVLHDYTITVAAGNGINKVAATGWTNTGTASMSKTFHYGDTINLAASSNNIVTPTRKTGYTGSSYEKTSGSGSISNGVFTVGNGDATITVSATGISTPTATISAGTTKVYNYEATTLTAGDAGSYDSGITLNYEFGSSDTSNGTYAYGDAQTSKTTSVAKDAYCGTKYYKVKVTASDGTLTSSTATSSSPTTMTLNTPTITFNATDNGGTLSGTSTLYTKYNNASLYSASCGSTAGTIPSASKTGYTFNGWYTAASGGSKVYNASGALQKNISGYTSNESTPKWIATANKTLYAQYTANTYTVTLNKNANSAVAGTNSVTATYDSAMPTDNVTMPTRTGYTFAGYYDTDAATGGTQYYTANGASARTWNKTSNTTLYARWTANCNAITLNANSGTAGSVTTLYKKTDTTGWFSDSGCSTAWTSGSNIVPTRTNYTFRGFYPSQVADVTQTNTSQTRYITNSGSTATSGTNWTVNAPATLYAGWATNCVQPSNGKGSCELTISGNNTTYTTTCNTGYTIGNNGKYNPSCTANCNAITVDNTTRGGNTANTTLYKYTDSTKWYSSKTNATTCATEITTTSRPSKTNATFAGYYTASNDTDTSVGTSANPSVLSTTWTVNADATIYAHYNCNSNYNQSGTDISGTCNANTYTITLDDSTNGGTGGTGSAKEVYASKWTNASGNTITSVAVPTKTASGSNYYVFTGYYDAASNGNQKIPANGALPDNTTFTSDTTLKAQFATCSCTKGTNVASCTVTGVTSNKCQYSYTCENGYHIGTNHNGTDTSSTFEGSVGVGSNQSGVCSGNKISFGMGTDHGTLPSSYTSYCMYGDNFTTPASMSEDGYTFNGWLPGDDYGNPFVNTPLASSTSVTCNYDNLGVYSGHVRLGGSWTANTYTVTLNKNADSAVAGTTSVTATYKSAMPTSGVTMPTRTGYKFMGYYDTDAATGGTQYYTENGASARIWNKTSDTTLYARWSAKTNTVTLNKNAANATAGTASVTATYDSAMPTDNVTMPTRNGYTFAGYYDTDAATGGTQYYTANGASARTWNKTSNTTLYARWTANTINVNWYQDSVENGATTPFTTGTCIYDDTLTVPTNYPQKNGYHINGWIVR